MPDPIDELENFSLQGPAMHPLPAAEVRRRGTHLRRRNNALAAVGGLALVAAIATPFAVVANQGPSSDSVAPAGTVEWQQTIPEDLDLTPGLPGAVVGDDYERQAVEVCEGAGWTPEADPQPVDTRQAIHQQTEGGWDRTLAVYADQEAATQTLAGIDDRVQSCEASSADQRRSTEVVDSAAGSVTYVDHMGDAGEMFVNRVVQVGNALLVETAFSMGGGDPEVVAEAAALMTEKSAPVVEQMCVFSASGCAADPEPSVGEGAVSAIPAGFPLDRGLTSPEGDPLIGPSPTAEGVPALELCGASVWPAPGVERLAVTATGPEYLETRELVTVASSDEIAAVVDEIRRAAADCPVSPDSGAGASNVTVHAALPAGADDAVTVSVLATDALGGGIYQFARVGRALYATYQSGEWAPETVDAGVADLTTDTERILPELCVWTERGC
ncbi:MAG: hypothetical protein WBP61_05040 [Nocardioides sp.]